MMSDYVPGIELSRAFYTEIVAPLLAGEPHSAALMGPGSEVLGFDTQRSADHDFGPRVQVFVEPDRIEAVRARVLEGLPSAFGGYPTTFDYHGVPAPGVSVGDSVAWLRGHLGFDVRAGVGLADWLSLPWQRLAEVTGGEVFHDDLGVLHQARQRLQWYPRDVWRYVLACQWQRIGQEEPFPGRCAEVGDTVGSAVVGARLAREVMQLALLLRRRYPPYAKWLGSALARLPGSAELCEGLARGVGAPTWQEREDGLSAAYARLAALQNRIALAPPQEASVRGFHDRPFRVIGGERFAAALRAEITDPYLASLPLVGCADQITDSVDLLGDLSAVRAVTSSALGLTHPAAA